MIRINTTRTIQRTDVYTTLGIFFAALIIYFYLAGNYVLCFQETQSLFVFSGEYLHQHLAKPGGLIEYAARFLTQFYHGKIEGALIVSIIITLPALILYRVNKHLIPGTSLSSVFLLVPSCLLFIMQANYFHLMEHNLGFLMVLAYYLIVVSSASKLGRILAIALFPLFYYFAGAYAMFFAALFILHYLVFEKEGRFLFPLLLVFTGGITYLVAWKILFLQTPSQLAMYPLPVLNKFSYIANFSILAAYTICYPLICRFILKIQGSRFNTRIYSLGSLAIVFTISIYLVFKTFNPQTARIVELQRLIYDEKWDEAVRLHEKKPAKNLISEFFYNVALSETDQLCDRLFNSSQDFGTGSLVLPWGDEHLNRGAYFYYAIGLINEAHRWAYEEMVVFGARPQNIRMLVKTSLIRGDYELAVKYSEILKRTIYYRQWALKCEKMAGNPDLIKNDPEFKAKIKILPRNNFFVQFNEPQTNIPLILDGQPDNRKAFDYYLAGQLLTKNVEGIVGNIKKLKEIGYTRIPRHIEEAALAYINSTRTMPDLGGLTISQETQSRFNKYFNAYLLARNNPSERKAKLEKEFGNTFWYYFHFK